MYVLIYTQVMQLCFRLRSRDVKLGVNLVVGWFRYRIWSIASFNCIVKQYRNFVICFDFVLSIFSRIVTSNNKSNKIIDHMSHYFGYILYITRVKVEVMAGIRVRIWVVVRLWFRLWLGLGWDWVRVMVKIMVKANTMVGFNK